MTVNQLIEKHNSNLPRYTSYPTVPYWNMTSYSASDWIKQVKKTVNDNSKIEISLYVHLPFCESMCTFCGCNKYITKNHGWESKYIVLLIKELAFYQKQFKNKLQVKALHLGGGTPSFFSPLNLNYLISELKGNVSFSNDCEMSFEAHPNNTTPQHLALLSKQGFKRLSFGIQDYDTEVQKCINRIQHFEDVKSIHNSAKSYQYAVSHDLVYGLPKQSIKSITNSINKTLELKPERISLYSYAHVPWIKGNGQRGFDENDLPNASLKHQLKMAATNLLLQNGYKEVGMDHFVLEKDELYLAKENGTLYRNFMGYDIKRSKYMIGIGVSAISESTNGFAQNVKTLKEYEQKIQSQGNAIFRGHQDAETDRLIRNSITQLMCFLELNITLCLKALPQFAEIEKSLKKYEQEGFLTLNKDQVKVTELGKHFIRNIASVFDVYLSHKDSYQNTFSKAI